MNKIQANDLGVAQRLIESAAFELQAGRRLKDDAITRLQAAADIVSVMRYQAFGSDTSTEAIFGPGSDATRDQAMADRLINARGILQIHPCLWG